MSCQILHTASNAGCSYPPEELTAVTFRNSYFPQCLASSLAFKQFQDYDTFLLKCCIMDRFIQIQYMSKVNKDGDNRRNTAAFPHLDMILSKVILQIQWLLVLIALSCDGFSFLYNRERYR